MIIRIGHIKELLLLVPTIAFSQMDGSCVIAIHYLFWFIACEFKIRRKKHE